MLIDEPPDPVWDGMSRADFLRIAAAIRWTADQMNLRDWRLQLKWEASGGGCYARCEVLGDIRTVNIWVCETFACMPEPEQRRCIVHELIHVHLDPLTEVGDKVCRDYLGLATYEMLGQEQHTAVERACESMAMAWSQTVDPIPATLTADDDIAIRLQNGTKMEIGEYLGLDLDNKGDADAG